MAARGLRAMRATLAALIVVRTAGDTSEQFRACDAPGTRFRGDPLKVVHGLESVGHCRNACVKYLSCLQWSFVTSQARRLSPGTLPAMPIGTSCRLFDGVAEQEAADESTISGPVACAPSESRAPLETADAPFKEVDREGEAAPSNRFGRPGPKPTNAWWTTMATNKNLGSMGDFMTQMPYILGPDSHGVHVMQPFTTSPGMEEFQQGLGIFLGHDSAEDRLEGPIADAWDEGCVTMAYRKGHGTSFKGLTLPVCRGSAYVTGEFRSLRPVVSSQLMLAEPKKLRVDGKEVDCGDFVQGKEIMFTLSTGDTWLVIFPPNMGWTCKSWPFRLMAAEVTPPQGAAVQVAMIKGKNPGCDVERWVKLLRDHAGSYPVASGVDFHVGLNSDDGEVIFNWARFSRVVAGYPDQDAVLQLFWPVHTPLLKLEVQEQLDSAPQTAFRDLRGLPKPLVVASPVVLTYRLYPIPAGEFSGRLSIPSAGILREAIEEALLGGGHRMAGAKFDGSKFDSDFELPQNVKLGVGDTYFSGKLTARLARLIAIADEIGKSKEPFFERMLDDLQQTMEAWLKKSGKTPFIYDRSWGGLVSCGCTYDDCWNSCAPHCTNDVSQPSTCPALHNVGYNFGNGYYNDHHFHYGYWVYSMAVLAKFRAHWEPKWREPMMSLIRDYANPSSADKKFPICRHKDWFLGFSWAGGIKFEPLGRNQESVSEAINSYYALAVYGTVLANRGNEDSAVGLQLRQLGRLLTAMEVHAGDMYWHVRPGGALYPNFQYPTVGIMWEHVCLHQTWFGGKGWAVEGIQMLPVVPALEDFLDKSWVEQHFLAYKDSCDSDPSCKQLGWSWLVCVQQAVLSVSDAFECLRKLGDEAFSTQTAAASGNSLTNLLVWLSTRPGIHDDLKPWPRIAEAEIVTTPRPVKAKKHEDLPIKKIGNHGVKMNNHCFEGDDVSCPNIPAIRCIGDSCCPDGSLCPSAKYYSNKLCAHPKKEACRGTDGDDPAEAEAEKAEKENKGHCKPGSAVLCPGSDWEYCEKSQCCPDGSLCPSAPLSASGCAKPKAHDCTGQHPPALTRPPKRCEVGESVTCPGSDLRCWGSVCCPDGTPCPSAPNTALCWKKEKVVDCTVQEPVQEQQRDEEFDHVDLEAHHEGGEDGEHFDGFGKADNQEDEDFGPFGKDGDNGAADGDQEDASEEASGDFQEEEEEEAEPKHTRGCDPENKCLWGASVKCANGKDWCSGSGCCPDGSLCPSAPPLAAGTTGCPLKKKYDCTCAETVEITGHATCLVGEAVKCPHHKDVTCAAMDCCPDGSACPSAPLGTPCPKPKISDCTGQTVTQMKAEEEGLHLLVHAGNPTTAFQVPLSFSGVAGIAAGAALLSAAAFMVQARRREPQVSADYSSDEAVAMISSHL